MHQSAMKYGKAFFETYCQNDMTGKVVIDVGAQDVNGSLREFCPVGAKYIGVDFVKGKGVDIILDDPYKLPFDDNSVDVVVCSSVFEHSEFFWLLFLECIRIVKPQGLVYLNSPSNGKVHRFPIDSWRFYPDAGLALVRWAARNSFQSLLLESFLGEKMGPIEGEGVWNDFVAVFLKDKDYEKLYPLRIQKNQGDSFGGYSSTWKNVFEGDVNNPDYQLILKNKQLLDLSNDLLLNANICIAEYKALISERDIQISEFNRKISERDIKISECSKTIYEHNRQSSEFEQVIANRDKNIAVLLGSIEEIRNSRSWKLTHPIRSLASKFRRIQGIFTTLLYILEVSGGLFPAFKKTIKLFLAEGLSGVRARIIFMMRQRTYKSMSSSSLSNPELNKIKGVSKFNVVPYFIDPRLDAAKVKYQTTATIAVHLHLYYTEMLEELSSYLRNIPYDFDLYVSVPSGSDSTALQLRFSENLDNAKLIAVECVPNRGRDIAPLIIQFGGRLAKYEIVGHFHSKKSPHKAGLANWCQDIMGKLMGEPGSFGGRIAHMVDLLQTTAIFVYPEGRTQFLPNGNGWADNYDIAKILLDRHTLISISDFPNVEFSEGAMFWARTESLKEFLLLPLAYEDFPVEPITSDGTLAHALERLLMIFASSTEGQCIRIHTSDSIKDYRHYEEQQDFSLRIEHSDIKVLTYYLPQFHPIPENDLWHGEGFTEWTKVAASNPLFVGHYQQHIPHSDIGYYLLDSPDTLRIQANQMEKAGVHGQVFYHYWFDGKLILQEPAKILLNSPDISMPFCFCWANENWTRRWDGNENEILLGQNYSVLDAEAFINYLMPFFKDRRYIKIGGRPVLYVYRPSSIPNVHEYLEVWKRECAKVGVAQPYVVAVLTRGAVDPRDFGMDAGVERVLHDWTSGGAPEIKETLSLFNPLNGTVLHYDDVVKYYTSQVEQKDFTYFRSTVPMWDNTARYGSEAYLLHGSTPQSFQSWMESAIEYSELTLPLDRRFLLVNAWNEWAEGAHLEPDSRYGYSYLNAVGRALSRIPYTSQMNSGESIPSNIRLRISIPEYILMQLRRDECLKNIFINCLGRSSVLDKCLVSVDTNEFCNDLPRLSFENSSNFDYSLVFHHLAVFDTLVIEKMLLTAHSSGSSVIANSYESCRNVTPVTENGSVNYNEANNPPLLLFSKKTEIEGFKNFRMRTDTKCIKLIANADEINSNEMVTTIIRFHKSADFSELKNALCCLYAMMGCTVIPFVAAQDLSGLQVAELENTLKEFSWSSEHQPRVQLYYSKDNAGDLRSIMLNESLKQVDTRYVAFLDFDDLLLPHAYSWLIERLKKTNKAAAFGRVYSAIFESRSGLILKRDTSYEYGYSYDDFIDNNNAPLHSFMLDLSKLDLSNVIYFDDQRYMEDYLLTLQLLTRDNCDWDSLKENHYIGDYIHSSDRNHTLALTTVREREMLLASSEYMLCLKRINDMRRSVRARAPI